MAYAREQQDTNPLFNTFVQVAEECLGEGTGVQLHKRGSPVSSGREELGRVAVCVNPQVWWNRGMVPTPEPLLSPTLTVV